MIPPRILVIAGSDSGGGAGIQADIRAITMFGGHAMTAVTAITAQDTRSVAEVLVVPAPLVLKQIDMVVEDLGVDAVKIGMIGAAATAMQVADRLVTLRGVPIVFDPVMVASSGAELADKATIEAFARLTAVATVITPNLPELEALAGMSIGGLQELEDAALAFARERGVAVLAKGGHLAGETVTDVLVERGGTVTRLQAPRIETLNTHGTGCTLASALACGLAQGRALPDAAARAQRYTHAAIAEAPGFGHGFGPLGHALGTVPYALVLKED